MKTQIALILLTSHLAAADPVTEDPPRDRMVALGLSIGGTAASAAGFAVGASLGWDRGHNLILGSLASTLLTPSLGEWYAGQGITVGLGLRVGGVLVAGLGVVMVGGGLVFGNNCEPGECGTTSDTNSHSSGALLGAGLLFAFGGTVTYLAGIVYDIVDAPSAADRYNNKHNLYLAPTVLPTASGNVPAMSLSGRF
jgi:hypothetical protein